jgi:hypothetical protein
MEGHASGAQRGEEAVYAGFALFLTERRAVVSSRGAGLRLWGRVDSPRQDRKAVRKPGFPFQLAFIRALTGNQVPTRLENWRVPLIAGRDATHNVSRSHRASDRQQVEPADCGSQKWVLFSPPILGLTQPVPYRCPI